MLSDTKVQDYMTTSVISVSPTTPIRISQQLMEDHHIRHLPVVQENKLVGILSWGDIRQAGPSTTMTLSIWQIAQLWEQVTVGQVMNHQVVRIRPDTLMTHAAQLMSAYHFNSLPVVDNEDRLIGILTDVDLFRLLVDVTRDEKIAVRIATVPLPAEVT